MKSIYYILISLAIISMLVVLGYYTGFIPFGFRTEENCVQVRSEDECISNNYEYTYGYCIPSGDLENMCVELTQSACYDKCIDLYGTPTVTTTPIVTTIPSGDLCQNDNDCCDSSTNGYWVDCYYSQGAGRYQCRWSSTQLSGYAYCDYSPVTTTPLPQDLCQDDIDCCSQISDLRYVDCYYSQGANRKQCRGSSIQLSGYYNCHPSDQCTIDSDCSKFCDSYKGMWADCFNGQCLFNSLQFEGYDYKCSETPGLIECGKAIRVELHSQDSASQFCDESHLCYIIWANCDTGNYWKCQKTTTGEYVSVLHSTGYDYFEQEYEMVCGEPDCQLQAQPCGIINSCCKGLICVNNICSLPPLECGNGICEPGEDNDNCPEDCGLPSDCKLEGESCGGLLNIYGKCCKFNPDNPDVKLECKDNKCVKTLESLIPWKLIFVGFTGFIGFIIPPLLVTKKKDKGKGVVIGIIVGLLVSFIMFYLFTYVYDFNELLKMMS